MHLAEQGAGKTDRLVDRDCGLSARGKSRFRVLWVHDTATKTGGCEQYIVRTAQLLRKRGVVSSLLYGNSGNGSLEMLSGFDHSFPLVDLAQQIDAIQPDVIYAHRVSGCATVEAIAKSGIPSLRFFHDHKLFCPREHKYTVVTQTTCTRRIGLGCVACLGVINRSSSWPGIRIQSVAALKQEQAAHGRMSGYVVGSDYMANQLAEHGFDRGKIHVLPLFADPPAETAPVARVSGQLLFVGQIVRGKGLDLLIRALPSIAPQVQLTVVGTGAQEDEMHRLAARLGVASRVTFVGKKDQRELAEYYQLASCLVLPSRSPETFAQVGVEAMSHGLPTIATNVGGISQWLVDEVNGLLCEPNQPLALAKAINRFVADPNLASRLGKNCVSDYRLRFQPDRHVDALQTLLVHTATSNRS